MAQGHMSVDTVEGSSVLQMRDEPTSVDAGNSEFFRATEARSSNVISSSPSASHDRARPLSESFYSCSQSSKEHNGECSADVPMTPTGEETAEATSESAEGVAGFFTTDQAAKILLQIAVGMSQVDNYTTHRDLQASNVLIDKHRQHGGRYKPKRYSYE